MISRQRPTKTFRAPAGSRRATRAGNTVIEFFFAFQVLLWLAFGMVDFGQYFYIRHVFDSAARDGVRVAILPTATQAQVVAAMTKTISQAGMSYSGTWLTMTQSSDGVNFSSFSDASTVVAGNEICLALSTNYSNLPNAIRPLYNLTGKGITNAKVVAGQATMVKE